MSRRRIARTCIWLALIGFPIPIRCESVQDVRISSLAQARTLFERSLDSFLQRDWNSARGGFLALDRYLAEHPGEAASFDHATRGFSWVDLTDRLASIRPDPAAPPLVHRMLVLLAARSDFAWDGREWRGSMGGNDRAVAERALAGAGLIVEALSGGRIRLEGEVVTLDATLTRLFSPGGLPGEPLRSAGHLQAEPESLSPFPTAFLLAKLAAFDTMVLVWDHADVKDRLGSFATAFGSVMPVPLVPGFLYGPPRGLVILSKALMDRPGTWVHEWFHVAEDALGIVLVHGFQAEIRSHFPGWKGQGEFDYYEWQLGAASSGGGLDSLDLKRRHPSGLTADHVAFARDYAARPEAMPYAELLKSLQADHAAGRFPQALAKAETLVALGPDAEGGRYWRGVELARLKRPDEAIAAFTEAIARDPAISRSYVYRGQLHGEAGRGAECISDFRKALAVTKAQADFIRSFLRRRAERGDAWATKGLQDLGLSEQDRAGG